MNLYSLNQTISFNDKAYFVKTKLENDILALANEDKSGYSEKFLMDEMANFERYLYAYKLSEAKIILTGIVDLWDKKKNLSELEQAILATHSEILYYNLLSNIENIDQDLLNLHLKLEKIELAQLPENERNEKALGMLNNRITLSNALLKISKYKLAKLVIEENMEELA